MAQLPQRVRADADSPEPDAGAAEPVDPSSPVRATRMQELLADLVRRVPDIEAAAVVSVDGLPMASSMPADLDEERVAAMAATLLSLGERAADGLGRGAPSQVHVEGERGSVSLLAAGDGAVLVGVASKRAKAGLVLFELRQVKRAIEGLLAEEATDGPGGDDPRDADAPEPHPGQAGATPAPRAGMHPTGRPLARSTAGTAWS